MNPFEKHGALRVNGRDLTDADGNAVKLFGMSTHGLAWRPKYVNEETFRTLRDKWSTNTVRLALYTHEYHGYCTDGDKQELYSLVTKGIDLAVKLGMYVIADWHVLGEFSPLVYADEAEAFFDRLSSEYADVPNLIYEICNEPNGPASWDEIKEYSDRVVPVIRKNSPNSVILVGTPEWSQRCDEALADPLPYENIMYSFHFYAATHFDGLRSRLTKCLDEGLPVFISECSLTEASGHGDIDLVSTREWFSIIDRYGLSYLCWSLSASPESSGIFNYGCTKLSDWEEDDLKKTGIWFKNRFLSENNDQQAENN